MNSTSRTRLELRLLPAQAARVEVENKIGRTLWTRHCRCCLTDREREEREARAQQQTEHSIDKARLYLSSEIDIPT